MPVNKALVGKEYPPATCEVKADATQAYAASYNQVSPWYFDERRPGGIVACPMFGMVYTWEAAIVPMFDADLQVNLMKVVRGGIDIRLFGTVRPGDLLTTRARVAAVEEKSSGELLTIETHTVNQRGEKVSTILNHNFIRGDKKGEKRAEPAAASQPVRPVALFVEKMKVKPDQSIVYAKPSRDENPIHTDDNVARMVGFPGVILQGSCTMAFGCGHVVDRACGGDPSRLRRIAVRFSKPVFPNDELTTTVWAVEDKPGGRVLGLEMVNQNGVAVLTDGVAEVAI